MVNADGRRVNCTGGPDMAPQPPRSSRPGEAVALLVDPYYTSMRGGVDMASMKQRQAARRNIKKAAAAAKRKQTLKHLPKRTRQALGKEAAKARRRAA